MVRDGVGRLAGGRGAAMLALRAAPLVTVGCALLRCASGVTPVAAVWLAKLVLDGLARSLVGHQAGAGASLAALVVGLAAVGLVGGALPAATRYATGELDRRVGLLAMDLLYRAVDGFSGLARFEQPVFLDRLRLAQQAGGKTPAQVVNSLLAIAQAGITLTGLFGSLIVLNPTMAAVVLVAGLPALGAQLALSRRRAAMMWGLGPVERREVFYAGLLTNAQAAMEIRLFDAGGFLRRRMGAERTAANRARREIDRRELRTQVALALLSAGVAGAGLVWAVHAAGSGRLTIGDVSLFIATVAGVQSGLASLVSEAAVLHHHLLLFDHYLAIVRAAPDLPVPANPRPALPLRSGIQLDDVWFRYSDEHPWALQGVSLFIPAGATTALVGLNGSGKSTVVKLLCRLYDPTRGSVRWDGIDLRDLPAAEVRRRISILFQDFMSYDLTAAENIALAETTTADRDRVRAAADEAGVHETIATLPHGYDTMLSRTFFTRSRDGIQHPGVLLSGGQWQRLALARALLRAGRDLLILDEPSAKLDAAAEQEIHDRLRADRAHLATLLISHRLGTVRDADHIVVLDTGVVTERGRHDELMAAGGTYARLFGLQARGYQDRSAQPPDPSSDPGGGTARTGVIVATSTTDRGEVKS